MRRLLATLAATASLAGLAACGTAPSTSGAGSDVAATVNGTTIPMSAYSALRDSLRQRLERTTGSLNPNTASGAQRLAQLQGTALRQLVGSVVVDQLAAARHITVSNADVDQATAGVASALGGPDQLALRLGDNGVSPDDARQALRTSLLVQRMRAADPTWDASYAKAVAAATVLAYAPPCLDDHIFPRCAGG
jgi:parvulin-like peptidyl-prolyl isomerase